MISPSFGQAALGFLFIGIICSCVTDTGEGEHPFLSEGRMIFRRASHTATLLTDGRVLIAGGFREDGRGNEPSIDAAEIYDPGTNIFRRITPMTTPRSGHQSVLLGSGSVLLVGGWGIGHRLASADLFDAGTQRFSPTGSMASPRAGFTATMLKNGTVLIAGGFQGPNVPRIPAEIYDPSTGMFTETGSLRRARAGHTATLLENGRVLLVGGFSGSSVESTAELYDPATGSFSLTGSMSFVRHKHDAALLESGDVLVIGGSNHLDWQGQYSTAEIYRSASGTFGSVLQMSSIRFKHAGTSVLLPDGNVLVGGGSAQIELFRASTSRFEPFTQLDQAYYFSTVTLLPDSTLMVVGGYDENIRTTNAVWRFAIQ